MSDTAPFALLVLLTSVAGLLAVLSNGLTGRLKVPAPALFLAAAAIAVRVVPDLHAPPERTVERIVTVALLCILFDGGLHIGWRRFRSAAGPIASVGVLGTFLTTAAGAVLAHFAFGFGWYVAVLLGTAVAPTDPAVVFSVLGQREVSGRSGTILEGESGANDPVGIALMASLLAAGGLGVGAFARVGGEFVLQMGVGALVGVAGGRLLLVFIRRVPLPAEALHPLRTLACSLVLYGVATLAHGSGFLAVFVAGIVLGDARAPYKREIERFHAALASLAEIVAFVVLGLTVNLDVLARTDVWVPGLLLFLLAARLPDAERLYGIVVVVVVFSVVVQGSLVPAVARLLHLPMRTIEPEPWALGVRLADEPEGVQRLTIVGGAPADGCTIAALASLPGDVWVSFVVRDRQLLAVRGDTRLQAGDEVLVLADPQLHDDLVRAFEHPAG